MAGKLRQPKPSSGLPFNACEIHHLPQLRQRIHSIGSKSTPQAQIKYLTRVLYGENIYVIMFRVIFFLSTAFLCNAQTVGASDNKLMNFFSSGAITDLQVGGTNVVRDATEVNGLFAVVFDGVAMEEIRFTDILINGNIIKAAGPNGFPRLEFRIEAIGGGETKLVLTRVEGMPKTRDASLLLRSATLVPVALESNGSQIVSEEEIGQFRVYWTPPVGEDESKGRSGFGSVTFKRKP